MLPILALLLGAASLNMGLGLQVSLLGLRADMEDFSALQSGLFMSSYYLGFVLGSYYGPLLVTRVGHIRTFAALASLASTTPLWHAVWVSPHWWILFRAMTGFCMAGLSLVVESWLNDRTDNQQRGTVLSAYMVSILAGTAVGQLFLNLASPNGYELFILVSVIISLSLIPVVLTSTPMPTLPGRATVSMARLFAETPLGMVGCFASGTMMGAFWSLGAIFARGIGLDTYGVSLFMSFMILGGILIQWPIGHLSDLIDRRLVIAGQNLLLALGGGMVVLDMVPVGPGLYLFIALFGGLLLPLYALSVAHVNDFLAREEFVGAGATLLLIYGLGAISGPLIAGLLMKLWGDTGLFLLILGVSALTGIYALYRISRRPAPAETESFVPVTGTTSMAYRMDPRAPEE